MVAYIMFIPQQPQKVEIWIIPILQVKKLRKLNLRLSLLNFPSILTTDQVL